MLRTVEQRMVKRMNAAERKGFAKYAREINAEERHLGMTPREPALGTLDQRLGIIIRRFTR